MRSGRSPQRERRGPRVAFALILAASKVHGAPHPDPDTDPGSAKEPDVKPTLVWVVTQLIPSPEIAAGQGDARFGLRWQVTPVLFSFGINRRLSPWRAIVVEPLVRQSGSIELYASPEIFTGSLWGSAMIRAGVRSYFPVLAKGEELSVSLGTSYTNLSGTNGTAFEAGVYVLYGTLGIQLTYSPSPSPVPWITTLRFRYF
jgi:hypothetical protein